MHNRHVSEIVLSLFFISGEAFCLTVISSRSSPQHNFPRARAHLYFCERNASLQNMPL